MNCAYHSVNTAVVNCNGCGKPLCPACDHRIKGFPYCQDCIVTGVGLLRDRQSLAYVPIVKSKSSPVLATLLSLICPGLGAAYNGQSTKALVHFSVFVGLFQLAVLSGGTALFVLGFMGMWLFAAVDAYRTAQLIRSGVSPDGAEDFIVSRFSSNPKLWGIVLLGLGALFFLQNVLPIRSLLRSAIPILIIALGLYLLRKYFFGVRDKKVRDNYLNEPSGSYSGSYTEADFRTGEFGASRERKSGGWRG